MADGLKRRDYAFALVLLSPLHIGSGTERDDLLPEIDENGEARKVPVAAIQRDHAGKPWIPGPTIKGALAAIARAQRLAEAAALFGQIKADDSGTMGAVLVRGASMTKAGPTVGLPFAAGGVFVVSRTSIDSGRGIAAANRLFHAEAVATGASFDVRLRLETRGDIAALEAALLKVLGAFVAPEGVAIGADQASGQGRLRLAGQVSVWEWKAKGTGLLQQDRQRSVKPSQPQGSGQGVALTLICDDPYLSRDPAWTAKARRQAEAADKAANRNRTLPHLRALRQGDVPLVTGQGVSGALRARAAWLDAAAAVAAGQPVAERTVQLGDVTTAARLQPHERLFGVTGFRGVLTVSVGTVSTKGKAALTSVKIDRFAGGGIDNALFGTDADYGVRLGLTLTLDVRATEEDRRARDALVADLRANGLALGHGTSRGFGWFRVEA